MSLSDSIKAMRIKALLSQEDFAKALKVSVGSINRWENGKVIPNITTMKKLRNFCAENSLPYDTIENEWLKERN